MDAISHEGIPTRVAYTRSPKYGWHLAIGVPQAELTATAYQTILLFLGIALALLTGGAILAARIGRRISHAITSLVPAAHGLGNGECVVLQDTGVLEVDQVSSALVHTGDALRSTEIERKRAEEALTVAKERAEEILSSITDGFYALNRDWRFTYINGRAQEILGKSLEQVLGTRFFDLFPQVEGTIVHENYRSVMAVRKPRQFDFISPILKRWTAFSVYPAGDGGIAVYFRDISAQKAAEAELVSAKEAAERANHAKTQFLAAASHDLRQPVQSLFFFHEALTAKLKDHPCAQTIANMDSGLNALKSLLDGLLDISRLHAGAVDVQKTVFPLAGLFDRLETEYAVHAEIQGATLRMVRSTAWVRSDMAQLERILRNLLDNALKYIGNGGTVLLGCRRSGDTLRIEIVDTGPGIPQDKLEAIFDEFVQLGNPERDRAKGLGLGLAIVRQLGRLLDHDIKVRSRLGHGTSFSVSMPMAKAQRKSTPRIARVHAPTGSGLVLIVDDEALILLGLRSMLEGWGWEVMAASSGKEAVRLVTGSSRAPDVIVADYRLRDGETGVNVIHDVYGVCARTIPAMVLTGDTSPERISECRQSGFRLMHKPIGSAILQAALEEMMKDGEKLRA
jgi:signal transduction histidine kinase/ActR/RegA family two-component response regulator